MVPFLISLPVRAAPRLRESRGGFVLVRSLAVAALAAWAVLPGVATAAKPAARYYLALGDSLSQGVQPDIRGVSLETDQGYADQLLAIERRQIPTLRLIKLGCPGETTTSMLTGHGNGANAKLFRCARTGGSQLKAAELSLRTHHRPGEVALVTVDIGANDVDGCAAPGVNVVRCVAAGEASIKRNLPLILRGVRHAAAGRTVLAGMTLYDPILSGYFNASASVRALAAASVAFLKMINREISAANRDAGFRTADVAGGFKSYDGTVGVPYNGQMVPVNVARVCSWTWACTPPPSGPNIHANKNGYAVIAREFGHVIGRLPRIAVTAPPAPPPAGGLG
jgi:lysophospholipase L1-like esterase